MKNLVINKVEVKLEVVDDEIFSTSLQIAEVFEKRHDNVLQAIYNLPDDDFRRANFKESAKVRKNGVFDKETKYYNITKDGFTLLVMGFTGEKAYKWKVEYIKAFNLMKELLEKQTHDKYYKEIFDLRAETKKLKKENDDLWDSIKKLRAPQPTVVKKDEEKEELNRRIKFLEEELEKKTREFERMDEKLGTDLEHYRSSAEGLEYDLKIANSQLSYERTSKALLRNGAIFRLESILNESKHIEDEAWSCLSLLKDEQKKSDDQA